MADRTGFGLVIVIFVNPPHRLIAILGYSVARLATIVPADADNAAFS